MYILVVLLCVPKAALSQVLDVEAFVQQTFIHGVPYQEARVYSTPSDVAALARMLGDEAAQPYWPQVVAVLGIAGGESALCPLVEFLQTDTASAAAAEARATVPLALGYAIHTDWSDDGWVLSGTYKAALALLSAGLEPAVWKMGAIPEITLACPSLVLPPNDHLSDRFARELSRRAVLGLAVAGHQDAYKALDDLGVAINENGDSALLFGRSFPEILETSERIVERGLIDYYTGTN